MKRIVLVVVCLFLSCAKSSYAQKYQWQPLPTGIICADSSVGQSDNCHIEHLLRDTIHNLLWVTGKFDSVQGSQGPSVATWNGSKFIPNLISRNPFTVEDIVMYDSGLAISRNNGVVLYNISTGNGTTIANSSGPINSLCVYKGDLIAGGRFFSIDGVDANSIARWDGTKWNPLGKGVGGDAYIVYAMKVYNDELYVGGAFDSAGGVSTWNIARWNGTSWNEVGGQGTDNYSRHHIAAAVFSMDVFQNNLYIGGRLNYIDNNGNEIETYLAYWDGINWAGTTYPYGDGFTETRRMKAGDSALYLTTLSAVGGVYSWNGHVTALVDSGFNDGNPALEIFNGVLYAGGIFDSSGNTPIFRIARLVPDTIYDEGKVVIENNQINIYPNPVTNQLAVTSQQTGEIEIKDLLGRTIKEQGIRNKDKISLDVSELPAGIYLLRMKTKEGWLVGKFVKE